MPQRHDGPGGRSLIGVSGRRKKAAQIAGFPETLADVDTDVYMADYARGVVDAGGLPVYLPPDAAPHELVDRLDGVLLTGGADIDPSWWGSPQETDEFPPELARDRFELAIIDRANTLALPVLGICRGMQLLNVHGGGSLHQDVPEHARFDQRPDGVAHELDVAPGTLLRRVCGGRLLVNSLHHQTIERLAPGWLVAAASADGTIEAIERPGVPVLGVQWHPEMLAGRATDPLFGWLVDEARRRRAAEAQQPAPGAR